MAKSGEEQISPSASFPVCTSLWLEKKEAHAKWRRSQSLSVSIPICAHFMIVRPSSRVCRAATVNSLFLVLLYWRIRTHTLVQYKKNPSLFDCNSIRCRAQFTFSHSRTSQRICPWPRRRFAHCICKWNKDGIHSDNTRCCLGGIHPSR